MLQFVAFWAVYSDPHGVSNNALCFANVFLPNLFFATQLQKPVMPRHCQIFYPPGLKQCILIH